MKKKKLKLSLNKKVISKVNLENTRGGGSVVDCQTNPMNFRTIGCCSGAARCTDDRINTFITQCNCW